ncbi:DnaD domain protein [Fredinandcohnia quinoae]|uniref:DnaD domain protein n=1 Tax=Fredinandcohnia quinoae TaxID=2918902 RepID=A0AAW5DUZ7_9BACI|nr:DnaD domain protein [Fredinandcohnia sp. SECRCQ15]MCH1624467.1 DnaD domain protein [Fredinandcohnia sp. SECRCQ15]
MAKFRMVPTDFWMNPEISEEMSPEDKYFYLYLLTNPHTTQCGIYKITKKKMAFDLGYSIESVQALMNRFIEHFGLIRYNPETRELAIKNWGKYNLKRAGKPMINCILTELEEVEDLSHIQYVAGNIRNDDILEIYKSFCKKDVHNELIEDQKLVGEQNEALQQEAHLPQIENNPDDVSEIIEFWDQNGFGLSNISAKDQLLGWLEDSEFMNPKDVILKAMGIACSNNKRKLNYVVGILNNWANESLMTVAEIDLYNPDKKPDSVKSKLMNRGRDIPTDCVLDITAGEDW